jgi:uncharacterized membrane protein YhaH (DUF805 family)
MSSASTHYFRWFYFSFIGRAGRQAYWFFWAVPSVLLGIVLGVIAHFTEHAISLLLLLLAPAFLWSSVAVSVKRLHDIGMSGWWTILCFIPYLNLVAAIVLGLISGKTGANAYGNDPHRPGEVTL